MIKVLYTIPLFLVLGGILGVILTKELAFTIVTVSGIALGAVLNWLGI